jgi:hypothetical protein
MTLLIKKIYDNEVTIDRYAVTFKGTKEVLAMSHNPNSPLGVSTLREGFAIGKEIKKTDLPMGCQKYLKDHDMI